MGSPLTEEWRDDVEDPRHRVTIGSTFAVGVYEVTFAEWDACVRAEGCGGCLPGDVGWGRGSRPVINVSWEDAPEYVRWLSRETGEGYRLLTEAEWEYVARGGTQTAQYWGDDASNQCSYGNGNDNDAECSDGFEYPAGGLLPGRTPSGCMTFWAMSMSGRRTAGMTAIREPRPTGPHGGREIVPIVWSAAAPGSTIRWPSVRRTAAGTRPG